MKLALRIAGALGLLSGAAFVIVGLYVYFAAPGDSSADALFDALDTIAIGACGALIGAGLIVYGGQASKRDA